MKKWIRWQGVVAFVVVAALLGGFWFLFLDGLVKRVIEKTGTSMVGAEVNVGKASVNLIPLSVTVSALQVTNPEAPSTNSLECARIAFSLDSLNLIRRKVIINEMAVEGLRFGTPRTSPGAVVKPIEKKPAGEQKSLFALPVTTKSVSEILQTENLESLALIAASTDEVRKKKDGWQQRVEKLPNKGTIDAYKARIAKIKQSAGGIAGVASQVTELLAVSKDIEQDLDRVKQARAAFTTDLSAAKNLVDRAEQAPTGDVRRLLDKYSLSGAGLQNMSSMLFGDTLSSWVRTGMLWYTRLQTYLSRSETKRKNVTVVKPVRGRGVDVRFKEYHPLPDFLIDKTAVTAETTAGRLAGIIRNITPDQDVLGRPLTLSLAGQQLTAARSIDISGELNRVKPEKPEDTLKATVRALRTSEIVLSSSKDMPVTMQYALVDLDILATAHPAITMRITAGVKSAKLNAGGAEQASPFANAVRTALSKVTAFSLTADITGTPENYTVHFSSDLDKVLKNAAGSIVQDQRAKLEQQLKAGIQERTGGKLKEMRDSYGALNQQGGALDSIQEQLSSVLNDAASSGSGRLKLF